MSKPTKNVLFPPPAPFHISCRKHSSPHHCAKCRIVAAAPCLPIYRKHARVSGAVKRRAEGEGERERVCVSVCVCLCLYVCVSLPPPLSLSLPPSPSPSLCACVSVCPPPFPAPLSCAHVGRRERDTECTKHNKRLVPYVQARSS